MVADFGAQIELGIVSVAERGGTLAGFVVAYRRGDHFHLENVAVDPAFQGKGIGIALVHHVENKARAADCAGVELYTNEKMTGNLNWYPAIGYLETGRNKQDGFYRVFFRKELRSI